MSNFCTDEILTRMRKVYDFNSNRELAEYLAVKETTVSNWKARKSIPFEILLRVSSENNISLDWLVYGEEKNKAEQHSTAERMILEAFNDLDDRQKMQAVLFVGNLAQGGVANTKNQPTSDNGINISNSKVGNFAGRDLTVKGK